MIGKRLFSSERISERERGRGSANHERTSKSCSQHHIKLMYGNFFPLHSIRFFFNCKSFDRYLILFLVCWGWLQLFYCIIHLHLHTHAHKIEDFFSFTSKVKVSTLFNRNSIHTIFVHCLMGANIFVVVQNSSEPIF